MKTKIVTTLVCASLVSSSMAGDAWDIIRNTLYTNKHTHVWENLDASKTYRYDSAARTSFDTRSAQSVTAEKQFNQDLTVLAVAAVLAGATTLYEWWNAPQPVVSNLNR